MKMKFAAIGLLAAGSAIAADSNTLTVNATVNGTCKFTTATSTVNIANSGGAIDPSLATNATGQTTVQFRCTNGTTSAISADNGLNFSAGSRRVRIGATTNYMPYSLALTGAAQAGTGHGAGNEKTLTIDATIVAADHQNAAAGSYADTVLLSLTP